MSAADQYRFNSMLASVPELVHEANMADNRGHSIQEFEMSSAQTISRQISPSAVTDLAERLTDTCHLAADPALDSCCAIWNGMIDKRPTVVVCPASEADVSATTAFARDNGLPLCVRGGGTISRAQHLATAASPST